MNGNMDPLSALKDIHLPLDVSWWPLAPGWWGLLALIVLIAIAPLLIRSWRKPLAQQYAALLELDSIERSYRQSGDNCELTSALSILLRRFALATFPAEPVAGLVGQSWLEFLDKTGGNGTFSSEARALAVAPYQRNSDINGDKLLRIVREWIRRAPRYRVLNREQSS